MYSEIFKELGLTQNEAKIYQTLLEEGESTGGTIALKAKIHRRNVYDAVSRLLDKGLVFQILTKGENIYQAVNPAKLLEIIREKEKRFQEVLPELQKIHQTKPSAQQAFVYRGIEGFKNYLRDILRLKQNVFFIGAKGLWFDPQLKTFLKSFIREAARLGIKYHHIFDAEIQTKMPAVPVTVGPPYKFLPQKYSSQACLDVFGDHVVTFSGLGPGEIDDDIVIYVLIDAVLADSYRVWFQFIWDHLPEAEQNSGDFSKPAANPSPVRLA